MLALVCSASMALAVDDDTGPADADGQTSPEPLLSTRASVLPASRELELSAGFSYGKRDSFESLRQIRKRQFDIPVSASVGISRRVNLAVSVPFVYRFEELLTIEDTRTDEVYGIGDIVAGLSVQLIEETADRSNVTASLGVSVPSGKRFGSSDEQPDFFSSGTYGGSIQLSLSKSVDPAVLSLGLGYREDFANTRLGDGFRSGRSFNYSIGSGFAVNSALLFNARMSGSYHTQSRIFDDPLPGSSSEPVDIEMSMSYRLNRRGRLESGVTFGLNEDAGDARFSMSYVWSRRPE